MARGITITGTSGTATASGGTVAVHHTGLPNFFDITKVKIQPSGGSGPYKAEIFKKDTLGGGDLMGKWQSVAGNIYEPMDNSTGSPAEGNASDLVVRYEDADATGEFHLKITNTDTSDRTYSYSVTYEESLVFDSSRVATAQKIELLGTGSAIYLGGRTSSEVSLRRSGIGLLARLGDDSGYATFTASEINSDSSIFYLGGASAGAVSLRRSSTNLLVRLGDDSTYASVLMRDLLAVNGHVYFGDLTSSSPQLKQSGNSLLVRLGDDSGYANLWASQIVAAGDVIYFGGATSSHVALKRTSTDLLVRLGDDSGYASINGDSLSMETHLQTKNGVVYLGPAASSSYSMVKTNGALIVKFRRADDGAYVDVECADLGANNINGNAITGNELHAANGFNGTIGGVVFVDGIATV